MFKKAVIFLSLVAAAEAGRKNIKDSQRKNAVPEEILKAERALRKGGKSKNGGKSKGGGKSSQEEDKVDGETFCGIVSLAVSDIATSTTRLQCGNLSPELLAAMCPSQDDLCSADFSLADFCPEDCEQQCREFLEGNGSVSGCCPETRCCKGSDLSGDLICDVYAAAAAAAAASGFFECFDDLEREFCPCSDTTPMSYCADVAPDCTANCMTFSGNCCA